MNTQYKHQLRDVPPISQESTRPHPEADRVADLELQLKKISRSVRRLESTVDALASAINRINLNK